MPEVPIQKTGVLSMLKGVADALGGTFTDQKGIAVLYLQNSNGHGSIKALELSERISCMIYDIEFTSETEYLIEEREKRHLYLNYILEGYFEYKIGASSAYRRIGRHQNVIVAADANLKTFLRLPKNKRLRYVAINLGYSSNGKSTQDSVSELTSELMASFSKNEKRADYHGNYSLDILRTVQDLYALKTDGHIGRLLTGALIFKILGHQLEEHRMNTDGSLENQLGSADFESVQDVVTFLEKNMLQKHSVSALAEIAGMSKKQLQLSFKTVFKKTVGQFVMDFRLEKSKGLLLETDMDISEIGFALGFTSASYFTEVFKKKYLSTPKAYRYAMNDS